MGNKKTPLRFVVAVLAVFVLMSMFVGCGKPTATDENVVDTDPAHKSSATIESMTKDNILNSVDKGRSEEPENLPGKGLTVLPSTLEVHVMNLPGTPVLIKDQYFAILYGASDVQNATKVSTYLTEQEIKGLKYFLIPSTNPTTFSGALPVLVEHKPFLIGELRAGDPSGYLAELKENANQNRFVFERQVAGKIWYENGTRFEVLYPSGNDTEESGNTPTLVLEVRKNDVSFLITGEINSQIEKTLIERGKLLEVDYLIATNGAIEGSMSKDFIKALNPKVVIVGVSDSEPVGIDAETIEVVGTDTLKIITNGTEHRVITNK
ncbi:MAG TPA: hypothetical protein PKV16_04010 [Caldisericia bacterium]|nr:hypothetical protein [Caldisericia bacterium]HPF48475.1 hypothetical protein [Caldisericia bacterium]HPI83345.1 hypothetical protein [Caldisericia bacterium]HPQ92929.1 hypothetical protein [Caldisericia bacterium]HRV73973.1 hypothetical protein [Caldisericia bacterium]